MLRYCLREERSDVTIPNGCLREEHSDVTILTGIASTMLEVTDTVKCLCELAKGKRDNPHWHWIEHSRSNSSRDRHVASLLTKTLVNGECQAPI